MCVYIYIGVSKNRGVSPQIIQFNRVFHYKPSILGYPIFRNTHIYTKFPHAWLVINLLKHVVFVSRKRMIDVYVPSIIYHIVHNKNLSFNGDIPSYDSPSRTCRISTSLTIRNLHGGTHNLTVGFGVVNTGWPPGRHLKSRWIDKRSQLQATTNRPSCRLSLEF